MTAGDDESKPVVVFERFSIDFRKTITKAIILTNHNNRRKQCNEPIRVRSSYMQPAPSAGKCERASRDWLWFCISLVEKVARVLLANHRAKQLKTKANAIYFRCSIENSSEGLKFLCFSAAPSTALPISGASSQFFS